MQGSSIFRCASKVLRKVLENKVLVIKNSGTDCIHKTTTARGKQHGEVGPRLTSLPLSVEQIQANSDTCACVQRHIHIQHTCSHTRVTHRQANVSPSSLKFSQISNFGRTDRMKKKNGEKKKKKKHNMESTREERYRYGFPPKQNRAVFQSCLEALDMGLKFKQRESKWEELF